MKPVRIIAGGPPAINVIAVKLTPGQNGVGQLPQSSGRFGRGKSDRTPGFLALAVLSVGSLWLSPLNPSANAADTDAVANTTPVLTENTTAKEAPAPTSSKDEVESLREELRQLRKELKELSQATSSNSARLKAFSEKVVDIDAPKATNTNEGEYATRSDLEALRDVQDENTLRSIGTSSSLSGYLVNGQQHLVNLTGFAALGFSAGYDTLAKSSQTFKLTNIGLNLTGSLRLDPGSEGDVKWKVGLIASPTKVVNSVAVATTTTTQNVKVLTGASLTNKNGVYGLTTTSGTVAVNTTKATATAASTNASYVNLGDVYATYDIKTAKLVLEPDWTLQVQVGQYLTPYGIDPVATEDQIPTINKAQYVSKLGFGRDIGVQANGTFFNVNDPSSVTTPVIAYNLGVYNGSGPNALDTNKSIDVLARVVLSPFPQFFSTFRNLKFGANYYEGNLGQDHTELPTRRRYGGDVSWLRKPFLMNFEYVHGVDGYNGYNTNIENTTVVWPSPVAGSQSSDSYVATLFWTPSTLPDFQPWIRYDRFKPTSFNGLTPEATITGNLQSDIYSIGINWFIWSVEPITRRSYETQATNRVLKLQLGYDYIDQKALAKARHQVNAVVTYNF